MLFYLPGSIVKTLPREKGELLLSLGVFSPAVHPLYRRSLHNFVGEPGVPNEREHIMDTYKMYGVLRKTPVDDEKNDAWGFPNAPDLRPHDAKVLFVGDSFGIGSSVGSRQSPAAFFARLTHVPVYNASHGAYGLAQYLAIIRQAVQQLPPAQRFAGRDIVLLTFLGNDYTADIAQYDRNSLYVDHSLAWIARIGPLRSWIDYLRMVYAMPATGKTQPVGRYAPIPVTCDTAEHLPFALHPGFSLFTSSTRVLRYFAGARPFVEQLAAIKAQGFRIRVVVIPVALQVIYKDIDWGAMDPKSPCATSLPTIYATANDLRDHVVALYRHYGFETLDLTDILANAPQHCRYFQPADTHCTALGYEAIARAIADRWPDLGKETASAPDAPARQPTTR